MTQSKKNPLVLESSDGPSISMVGDNYRIIIGGDQTNNSYAVIDMLVGPGGGPGPHSHKDITETFYIVDGEIEFRSEAGTVVARPGTFVEIPAGGVVHGFKNKTEKPAHMICTVMPAGLDAFFLEVGQPMEAGKLLPHVQPTQEDIIRIGKVAKKYGQELYPPDYLDKLTGK